MPSNAAASSVAVPPRLAALVFAPGLKAPLVAAFIVISSATVAALPVISRAPVDVVMPSNAAARLAAVSS